MTDERKFQLVMLGYSVRKEWGWCWPFLGDKPIAEDALRSEVDAWAQCDSHEKAITASKREDR